jgi:hypothetical protein
MCNDSIIASADGITWKTIGSCDGMLRSLAWTGTQFAAAGNSGMFYTSPDGVTWTERNLSIGVTSLYGVVWADSLLFALGERGTLLTSPDGITWKKQKCLNTAVLKAAVWTGSLYVVLGFNGTIITSPHDDNSNVTRINCKKTSATTSSLRVNRTSISFSLPEVLDDKPVWATVYALSGQKMTPSRTVILYGRDGSFPIENLTAGLFVFELKAGDIRCTTLFRYPRTGCP